MEELRGAEDRASGTNGRGAEEAAPQRGTAHKQRARSAAESAKEQFEAAAAIGKDKVVDQLETFARALHSTGEHLESDEQGQAAAPYAHQAGATVERASRYLREREAMELVDDVSRIGRAEPLLFLGGAFVIGLALGRFLKSDTPRTEAADYLESAMRTREESW